MGVRCGTTGGGGGGVGGVCVVVVVGSVGGGGGSGSGGSGGDGGGDNAGSLVIAVTVVAAVASAAHRVEPPRGAKVALRPRPLTGLHGARRHPGPREVGREGVEEAAERRGGAGGGVDR